MAYPFEQPEEKDKQKPRDELEAKRLGDSRDASEVLENQIQNEQNLSKLPENDQKKAKEVINDIRTSIKTGDRIGLVNLMRNHRDILNALDPSIIINLNKELRRMAREERKEALKAGNMPVLTADTMELINKGSNIYAEIGKDLEARQQQKESPEISNDRQIAQFQERVETVKQKLNTLYTNLSRLQTPQNSNIA